MRRLSFHVHRREHGVRRRTAASRFRYGSIRRGVGGQVGLLPAES